MAQMDEEVVAMHLERLADPITGSPFKDPTTLAAPCIDIEASEDTNLLIAAKNPFDTKKYWSKPIKSMKPRRIPISAKITNRQQKALDRPTTKTPLQQRADDSRRHHTDIGLRDHSKRSVTSERKQLGHKEESDSRKSRGNQLAYKAEMEAFDKELDRMFKLQLGPLTLCKDIDPILLIWEKLSCLRLKYGRRRISRGWWRLAEATSIVGSKMSMKHILTLLDVQLTLMQPFCPPSLHLHSRMFLVLSERLDAGGQLAEASDAQLLQYISLVCKLLDNTMDTVAHDKINKKDIFSRTRAQLERIKILLPFFAHGIKELVGRHQSHWNIKSGNLWRKDGQYISQEIFGILIFVIHGIDILSNSLRTLEATDTIGSSCHRLEKQTQSSSSWFMRALSKTWRKCFRRKGNDLTEKVTARECFDLLNLRDELISTLSITFKPKLLQYVTSTHLKNLADNICVRITTPNNVQGNPNLLECARLVITEAAFRAKEKNRDKLPKPVRSSIADLAQQLGEEKHFLGETALQRLERLQKFWPFDIQRDGGNPKEVLFESCHNGDTEESMDAASIHLNVPDKESEEVCSILVN